MRASALLVATSTLLLSGCEIFNDNTTDIDTGVVTMETYSDGGTDFMVFPIAIFYREADLTFNLPPDNSCQVMRYNDQVPSPIQNYPTMNVGPSVLASLPSGEFPLFLDGASGVRLYKPNATVMHVPGDTIRVTVAANNSFPEATIAAKTAEAFTVDVSLDPLPPNANLPLTWTPPSEVGSFMQVSLRYENEQSVGELNEQVVCMLADDGSGEINATFLLGWNNAVGEQREVVATRVRARTVEINDKNRFIVVTTLQYPAPPFTP